MKNKFDLLKDKNQVNQLNSKNLLSDISKINSETKRVSNIAKNSNIIISDLDEKFKMATKLKKIDIAFLFLATALQVTRQYLMTNSKFNYLDKSNRLTDAEAAKKLGKSDYIRSYRDEDLYKTTVNEIIFNPVPYDTQNGGSSLGVSLGGGTEHRIHTFGHDPILGWIFGTANIATRTMTTAPNFKSYHIQYGNFQTGTGLKSKYKNDFIHSTAETSKILQYGILDKVLYPNREDNLLIFLTSLVQQGLHLKSDYNSKKSLSLPLASLNPQVAKELSKYGIDMASVGTIFSQAMIAEIINILVSSLHKLIVMSSSNDTDIRLINIRSNKVISYSNTIASSSNILHVALTKDFTKLDIGGFLVTLYRIITNRKLQRQLKQEFIEQEFYKLVMID